MLSAAQAHGVRARGQHLHRRRHLRRGPDHPRARGPPGRARGALRPVEVLRRAATASSSRRLHGLSTVSLRYGNVYGPRQDPLGEAGVIAIFCGKLLEGGKPTIFGDGEQTRDYVFVGDVVDANLRAAELRRHRRDQHRPRRADERARPRRGAERRTPTAASRPSTRPSARARCSTSRSTPRARGELLGWEAEVEPRRGPRASRSTRCAEHLLFEPEKSLLAGTDKGVSTL